MQIILPPKQRSYLSTNFAASTWTEIQPYFEELIHREIHNVQALELLITDLSELEAALHESRAWAYIETKCDTTNPLAMEKFMNFVQNVLPPAIELGQKMVEKIVNSPYTSQLTEKHYAIYLRLLKNEIELFRPENIDLGVKEQETSKSYFQKMASFTIEHEGEELTLQQAVKLMEQPDRILRQQVWQKIEGVRAKERQQFHAIYDELIALRSKISQNAGFDTYTDYAYTALERFDYQRENVYDFHKTVETVIKPIYEALLLERKEKLGLTQLRPWDMYINIVNTDTLLKPFQSGKELIEKTIDLLAEIRPEMAEPLQLMHNSGFLDVESRIGKAPGGFNYPLAESGLPFIFMNAAGSQSDITVMLHESGHAIHAYLDRNISITRLKNPPIEVAELASMTMELISMDYYSIFYEEEAECNMAKKEQLLRTLMVFQWIATVDAFQHWVYDHPQHTHTERGQKWKELYVRFHGNNLDWTGFEQELEHLWMKQIHIFEHPFYYIEYAFSQLGAIAVWRNYQQNPQAAIDNYLAALRLGYTKTLPEIYQTAGIAFNFSPEYVKPLIDFCYQKYQQIGNE
ncbi:MAG: M3 family oligoendopeptidase [Bacteroidia bacterium]